MFDKLLIALFLCLFTTSGGAIELPPVTSTYTYDFVSVNNDLYHEVTETTKSDSNVKTNTLNDILWIKPFETVRIRAVIPPGVSYYALMIQANKFIINKGSGHFYFWSTYDQTPQQEQYFFTTSTITVKFVEQDSSSGAIYTVDNDQAIGRAKESIGGGSSWQNSVWTNNDDAQYGYFMMTNTSSETFGIIAIKSSMLVDDVALYENWRTNTKSAVPNPNLGIGYEVSTSPVSSNATVTGTSTSNSPTSSTGSSSISTSSTQSTCPFGSCASNLTTTPTPTPTPSNVASCTTGSINPNTGECVSSSSNAPSSSIGSSSTISISESNNSTNTNPEGTYSQPTMNAPSAFYVWQSDSTSNSPSTDMTQHFNVRVENESQNLLSLSTEELSTFNLDADTVNKRDLIKIMGDDGTEVTLYPYAEDPQGLLDALKTFFPGSMVGLSDKGLLYAIVGDAFYYAYLDYYISKPIATTNSGELSFEVVESSEEMTIMNMIYPSGNQQKIYLYQTQLKTINN